MSGVTPLPGVPEPDPAALLPGVGGVAATWLDFGVGFLGPLVLVPVCLHFLGQQLYGTWLIIAGLSPVLGLSSLGLGWAGGNRLAACFSVADVEGARAAAAALAFGFAVAGVVVAALAVGGDFLASRWAPAWPAAGTDAFLIYFLLFASSLPLKAIPVLVRSAGRVQWEQLANAVSRVAKFTTSVCVLWVGLGLRSLAAAQGIAFILPGLICLRVARRVLPSIGRRDFGEGRRLLRHLLRPSMGFLVLQAAGVIAFSTDNLVIGGGLGAAMVPVYAVGFQAIMGLVMLWGSSLGAFAPAIAGMHARGDGAGLAQWWLRFSRIAVLFGGGAFMLLCLSGARLIRLWARRPLFPGARAWEFMLAFLVIEVVVFPADILLMATGRHSTYSRLAICEAAANLSLSILWVRPWGLAGVIGATLLSRVATNAWYLPIAASRTVSLSGVTVWRALGRPAVLAAAIMAALVGGAATLGFGAFRQPVLAGAAGAAAFALVFAWVGLTRSDRRWLGSAVCRAAAILGLAA